MDEFKRQGLGRSGLRWSTLLWIAFCGLTLRVVRGVFWPDVAHPDEVFQVLEPAHRLVYGYGLVPWEFRFGTRSWILPGFTASILMACKALGWSSPAVYVPAVKVVYSALSMSIPWACVARSLGVSGGVLQATWRSSPRSSPMS